VLSSLDVLLLTEVELPREPILSSSLSSYSPRCRTSSRRYVYLYRIVPLLISARRYRFDQWCSECLRLARQEWKHCFRWLHAPIPTMCSAHEEDHPRQQPYRHGHQRSIRMSSSYPTMYHTDDSLPLTRPLPSQHGGTSLLTWDPSLSRVPTSVICPDTSVVMSRLIPSCTSPPPSYPLLQHRPSSSRPNILTISAKSVEFYEQPGKLSKVPVDESKIPEEDRIPRITTAVWYVPVSLPDLS
jgi:hypothetical protein